MSRSSRRRQVARGLGGLFVGFGAALLAITVIEAIDEERPVEQLGSLDMEGYCSRDNPRATAMVLVSDAHGWQCVGPEAGVPRVVPIDTDAVCRWQYGDDARAVLVNPADTVGWACVRGGD